MGTLEIVLYLILFILILSLVKLLKSSGTSTPNLIDETNSNDSIDLAMTKMSLSSTLHDLNSSSSDGDSGSDSGDGGA